MNYSWLKPVPPRSPTTSAAVEESLGGGQVAVPTVLTGAIDSPRRAPKAEQQPVRAVQMTFDAAQAEFNDGINNGKHLGAEGQQRAAGSSNNKQRTASNRPKSAPRTRRKVVDKGSEDAAASRAPGDSSPEQHHNEQGHMRRDALSEETAPFGVSGRGYGGAAADEKGAKMNNLWTAALDADGPQPLPGKDGGRLHRGLAAGTKAPKAEHQQQNFFEFSARHASQEEPRTGGGNPNFSVAGMAPPTSPSKKSRKPRRPASARTASFDSSDLEDIQRRGDDDDRVRARPLAEYIAEAPVVEDMAAGSPSPPPPARSAREAELLHRERARSQKAADYKEKSLLRELQRLGVHGAL